MPELPEVEHAARTLGEQIAERRIVGVTKLDWERMIETPPAERFVELLRGRIVLAAGRRAKWLLLTLDEGWTLALHLRMSGAITVHGPTAQPDTHTHLVLLLDDGRQVFFHDTRKFGRARLLDADGMAALDAAHGPEPLTATFTPEALAAIVRARRTPIKQLLLDQKAIAGIGNIYADEALWLARLHPQRASNSLDSVEVARLHAGIRKVLLSGLAHGGSTLRNYRNSYGERGANQDHFNVYDQEGKPCPRCSTPIVRIVIAQRGARFCPACQQCNLPHS